MKKKKQNKYDIFEDKGDAFLEAYSEATEDTIQTLLNFNAFDEDFLQFVLRDFIKKYKEDVVDKKWHKIL